MLKTKLPRSDYFLAGYTAIVCCLAAALVWLRAPEELLIFLMGPIVFAALHYRRCVYQAMLLITVSVSFWVITQIATDFAESLRFLVAITLTVLIIAEVLHRLIAARTRVETALRESEERFRTVVEHLGEGLLITDLDDRVIYVNSRLAKLSGYSTAEMIGQPAYQLFLAPDEWSNLYRRNEQRRQGINERYEVQMHCKDGGHFWAEIHATPFRTITGEVVGTLGAVTDITERKHAQRLSAAFSALGQQLSSAMTAEAAARIIANVADEILGWDAFLLDLYAADEDAIYPVLMIDMINGKRTERSSSLFDRTPNRITRRTLRAGAQLLLERDPLDTTHWIPFGNPEHVSASLMLVPIRSGANTVGILSVQSYTPQAYSDADLQTLQALADHCGGALERTQAAEKLRESEARYRTISEATSDFVFTMRITPDGNAVTEWVTGAFSRITGYTLEEFDVLGGWKALVYPDDLPIYQRGQASAIDRPHEIEYRIQTKQGQIRWLRVYVRPAPEQEQVVRLIGAVQDVTERKRAEEAMLHAQKLESLGVLAGGIAHDFNNLLMAILGNAGLALLELPPNAGAKASIKQIEIAAQRAADLTHQMLAYSGKGHFVVQQLDLNMIVAEMADLLKASITKNALLSCQLARDLPAIEADTTQIRQILMNLIVNASDAIGDLPGAIHVTTGVMQADRAYLANTYLAPDLPAGAYAYIEVADTGCGMDAETLARIFDPFFTTKFTGRGLGLAAVLGIVRGHKGALKVQSAPGRGTTFRVLFPCVAGPSQPLVTASPVQSEQPGRGKVLIVDDEEVVRAVAKRMLERFGFAVLTAPDGHSGVETFRANADDIACTLLDMTMPHLNGEEAFRAIQRIKPDARVVLISGYNEQDMIDRFGGAGPAGFLQKPFTPADLREKVQLALGALR